jgi:dipeptidyl aminopeptidase/acylaminoacyl peptidase
MLKNEFFCKVFNVLLFLTSVVVISAQNNVFTAEKMWQLKRIGAPVVSNDGTRVLFSVTEFDIEKNSSKTNIFLSDINGNEMRQLTFGNKDSDPVWSPDDSRIAFVSGREGSTAQIYILDMRGGEGRRMTTLPTSPFAIKWFPNGKRIAFAARVHPDYGGDFKKLEDILKKQKEAKMTAKVTENVMYRYWDRWLTDSLYPRLFAIDIETETVTDLMPGFNNYFNLMGGVSYDISPDGTEIAVSANTVPPPFETTNADILLIATDGSGKFTNITTSNPASDTDPVYSKNGKYILYGRQKITHFYADKVEMVLYERQTKNHQVLTQDIDISCESWIWSKDENAIYFLAEDRALKSIFSFQLKTGKHEELFRSGTNNNISLSGQDKLVFRNNNFNRPDEIMVFDLIKKSHNQVTKINTDLLMPINLGKIENVIYKGWGEKDIQMFIVYPPDFDPANKYPLVFMLHGGPHGIFGDQFHYRWNAHLFAAPGYVVAIPNFHGSTSFGQDFAISIHGSHAEKPYEDVLKATDYMISRGFIDETKMAATGGSYGGYLVSWIAGHTGRFACLVNHAGVFDIFTQFASDYTMNRGHAYGGTPWENTDVMQEKNPAMFAANFQTPMLVIHGELDYRVPISHALLVYNIYRNRGLDARLVYYPNENHWILTAQNSIYWYKELHDWFERYLKN